MSGTERQEARWLGAGLALATGLAAADLALGGEAVLIGLLVLSPLLVAVRGGARPTAIAAAYSFVLAVVLGIPDMDFLGLDHFLRMAVVMVGGALAIWIASLRERAQQAEARSTFIAEAGMRLDTSLDFETAVTTLARVAVPWLADWCAVYALNEDGSISQLAVAHADPAKEEFAWELDRRYPFHLDQPVGVGNVIRTGEPELMQKVSDSAIDVSAYNEEHAQLLRGLGFKSAMFVPLRARGRTLGAIAFATAESGRTLDAEDLALARDLSDRASLALDNARLYTKASEAEAELRESADEVEAVLQGVASAITVQNGDGKLVYANEAAARLLGFTSIEALLDAAPDRILDRFDLFGEEGEPFPLEELPGSVALAGAPPRDAVIRFQDRATGEERWSVVKSTPVLDESGRPRLVINIFDDISRQKRGELEERFLSDASRVLVGSVEYEETLDNVAHLAVPNLADWCSVDLLDDRGTIRNVAIAHADPSKIELIEQLRLSHPPKPDQPRGVANVVRTGEPELYRDVSDELLVEGAESQEPLSLLHAGGFRSAIVAPMKVGGKVIGALSFAAGESGLRYDERHVGLVQELANRAATAVETARLYTERTHIARTLQRSLLPPVLPDIPGAEVAARFRPAGEGYEVGGDFYDVFNTGGAGWAIVIGDVCGKGPEAAALTGLARHTLRAAAMQEDDPSRILELLSEAIMTQRSDSEFCTAAYGRLELSTVGARMTVASGGHPLPLLLTEDGRVEQVGVHGTLLGSVPEAKLVDHALDLRPGSALVFYTDGVIEAGKPRGAFGIGGLRSLLASCIGLGAQEVAERIDNAVIGLEQNPADDVAVLVLRIRE